MYCQRCSEKGTHISFLATMQVVVLGIKEVAVVTKGRWNGGRKYYTTVAMFVCHSLNGRTNKTCFQQEFDRPWGRCRTVRARCAHGACTVRARFNVFGMVAQLVPR